jgi:hypothetical protein
MNRRLTIAICASYLLMTAACLLSLLLTGKLP